MVATGCSTIGYGQETAAELPPAPPIIDNTGEMQFLPTDGLHRLIVTPPPVDELETKSPLTEARQPGQEQANSDATEQASSVESFAKIDPLKLNKLTGDTTIVFQDGIPGYLDSAGDFVSLAVEDSPVIPETGDEDGTAENGTAGAGIEGTGTAPAETASGPADHPAIEQLRNLPDVVSVVAIGDGSYAVTSSNERVIEQLDPELAAALEIAPDAPLALFTDPYEPYQWALDNNGSNLANVQSPPPAQVIDADIDGTEAAAGPLGAGVVVAVIDTGVDTSHPDLATQMWQNPGETCGNSIDDDGNGYIDDCNGWDFGYEDNVPWSAGNGNHGTHVAGIIAAAAGNGEGIVGVAPDAKIMNLSVAGPGGLSTSSIARAIRYAVDNGAHVINMSLGSSPGTPAYAVTPMIDAVEYAESAGVVVVVAAGNSNVNLSTSPVYPANIDTDNMITVGASDADETKASYSNYGPVVTLFAPGSLILSTVPGGYSFMNGTSMASPIVAGIAATVLAANPTADPLTVRNQIVGTADEIDAYNNVSSSGARLNAARAVGINPDAVEADVSIRGLALATTDSVTAEISLHGGDLIDQPYRWEASLVAITEAGAFGIVEYPVAIGGQAATTDGRGAVLLSESDTPAVSLETSLPEGSYGLVVEAVSLADPDSRIGEAFVATFDIGDPPGSGGGGSGSTTTTVPVTTTTNPAVTTTTTVQATTTTQPGAGQTTTSGASPSTTAVSPTTSTTVTVTAPPTTSAATTSSTSPATTQTPSSTTQTTVSGTTTTAAQGGGGSSGGGGGNSGGSGGGGQTTTTAQPAPTTTQPAPTTTQPAPTTTQQAQTTTTIAQTTTTLATTTTTAAPNTTTTVADSSGTWFVDRISPDNGPTSAKSTVSVTGNFPSDAYVWFGNQAGEIIYRTSTWILVQTPAILSPGPVDVRVRKGSIDLVVPNGFTFYDPTPSQTTTTTIAATTTTTVGSGGGGGNITTTSVASAPSSSTSTTAGSGSTSTTSSSGGGTTTSTTSPGGGTGGGATSTTAGATTSTTTAQATTTTTAPAATTTTTAPGVPLAQRTLVLGDPVSLGGDLQGVPLSGLPGLTDIPRCASDPCRIRKI